MGLSEGKSLKTDSVPQNRLSAIKKIVKFDVNYKNSILRQTFRSWQSLSKDTLRSKIGLMVKKLFFFLIKSFLKSCEVDL